MVILSVTILGALTGAMKTGSKRLHFRHLGVSVLVIMMVAVENYMKVSNGVQPTIFTASAGWTWDERASTKRKKNRQQHTRQSAADFLRRETPPTRSCSYLPSRPQFRLRYLLNSLTSWYLPSGRPRASLISSYADACPSWTAWIGLSGMNWIP